MDAKTKAIVSHIPLIGWVIAFVLNNKQKEDLASFYIRQNLGLMLASLVVKLIPFPFVVINDLLLLPIFVLWLMSLISSIQGTKTPSPFVGGLFQEWFKTL